MDTVVPFAVAPKQDVLRHRRVEYTITYIPDTKMWEWSFSIVSTTTLHHQHPSYQEAMHTAREIIDNLHGAPCPT